MGTELGKDYTRTATINGQKWDVAISADYSGARQSLEAAHLTGKQRDSDRQWSATIDKLEDGSFRVSLGLNSKDGAMLASAEGIYKFNDKGHLVLQDGAQYQTFPGGKKFELPERMKDLGVSFRDPDVLAAERAAKSQGVGGWSVVTDGAKEARVMPKANGGRLPGGPPDR